MIRVDTVAELFDVGALLANQPLPAGRRVGVVGNSSALSALAATACVGHGLTVADGYPRDVGPAAGAARFAAALAEPAADERVDALVVVFAPPLPGQLDAEDADFDAPSRAVALAATSRPWRRSWSGGCRPGAGVPSVEEAVRALGRVRRVRRVAPRPPGVAPELPGVDRPAAQAALGADATGPGRAAGRVRHRRGPRCPSTRPTRRSAAAARLGLPVALKAAAPGLRHRLDLGAVRLDLADASTTSAARTPTWRRPSARTSLVQPMVPPGVPCVVEVVDDPAFGPVVGFGLGGVATELLGDRAWRAAPLTDRDAAGLVASPGRRRCCAATAAPRRSTGGAGRSAAAGRPARRRTAPGALADPNPVLARPDGISVLHAGAIGHPGTRPDTGPRRL